MVIIMDIIRRIIFYALFTVFLVLCPLLILYSLGYIVDPLKEKMVHTGAIHLSSWPSGAQVFLEKSHYKESTPVTIRDLLPGEYTIRMELKGHHLWTHKVQVEDGRAAAFDKILLIPNVWSSKEINVGPVKDLIPFIGTEFLLLSKGDQLKDYYIYDWKKNRVWPFLNARSEWADFRVSAVFLTEESDALVILGGPFWDQKYFYAQVKNQGAEIRDISKLMTQRPMNVKWDSNSRDIVFALHEGYVDRLDTASASLYPKYMEDIRGWGVGSGQIYMIDSNDHVLAAPVNKNDFQPVFEKSELAGLLAKEKDFYEIKALDSNTVIFMGSRSAIILNHARPYFINEKIIGIRHDPENNRLLVWTMKAIGIFDLSDEEEPSPSSGGLVKVDWVFDKGKDIRKCFWAHEGSHVIFTDGNSVFLLEPESQGPAHLDLVTVIKESSSIAYVEAKGACYYLGAQDGKLYVLDIVSKKEAESAAVKKAPAFRKDGP